MGNDAREIYEAVMEEVKKDLARMVPQYEEKILQSVEQKVMGQLSGLARKNEQLEDQLNVLRGQIESLKGNEMNTFEENRQVNLSDYSGYELCGINHFDFNGWIYYADSSMGDFMYKVRVNGADRQQLTDYSVGYLPSCAKVKNGKLYFMDCDRKEHSIDL